MQLVDNTSAARAPGVAGNNLLYGGDRSPMSEFGASPATIAEPRTSQMLIVADADSSRLRTPATVRSDRVVWLYVGHGRDDPSGGPGRLYPLAL